MIHHLMTLFAFGLCGVTLFTAAAWLLSLKLKDASLVDRFWGMNFILLSCIYLFLTKELYWRHYLALSLLAVWGLRLSFHIHMRNRGHGEDYRYQKMRKDHGKNFWWYSLFSVFFLQGLLSCFISAPILWIFAGPHAEWSWLDALAICAWSLGFFFETVGDFQLKKFKADPSNKNKILDQGLWGLCRHPNYFGDALIWWSFFLLAFCVEGGWMSFFGPLIMSFFLRYVSGVTLLEKTLRHSKPGFDSYVAKTPAFIPKIDIAAFISWLKNIF